MIEPTFDPRKTTDIQKLIAQWRNLPLAHVIDLLGQEYRYGYIGTEDRTMYPLILPGAIVQVDERRTRVARGPWRTEMERPIYFLETRTGFTCCWCSVQKDYIVLQPHPLSTQKAQILWLQEVTVIGQIVGIAMRLHSADFEPARKSI